LCVKLGNYQESSATCFGYPNHLQAIYKIMIGNIYYNAMNVNCIVIYFSYYDFLFSLKIAFVARNMLLMVNYRQSCVET